MRDIYRYTIVLVTMIFVMDVTDAAAQSFAMHVANGDRATVARNPNAALAAYESAISIDSTNVGVLQKAAKVAVTLAEFATPRTAQRTFRDKGEAYARMAFSHDSMSAESHFVMAQALGRSAQGNSPVVSLRYGVLVYAHGRRCLQIQPTHAGCAHVIGAWNAELIRLNAAFRTFAATYTKSPVYETANWDTAQAYLERAVAGEPNRVIHHLTLGRIYADRHNRKKAEEQFQAALRAPISDFNDEEYRKQASAGLKKLFEE